MKKNFKLKDFLGVGIALSIFAVVIFSLIFFFGGALMMLFGLKYSSIKVLFKFFLIYFIVDLFIDNILEGLAMAVKEVKELSDKEYNLLYFLIDVPVQVLILGLISSSISGIYMPVITMVLFAISCHLISYFIDKKLE
ncbi:YrvL family regulatory protein [Clostridium chauvoei]|uniref:Uncharacterized protein n=2 Tax=Clostridium chauvoei TaxID=46867 RepID=S6F722_9CLOT|nr:YrvL family regulatory protein [Clostridium chauvoei]ATD54210.1 hypothetical protein BTM20_02760 [Clostridium chauvoei]ATD58110.1 hypothetical protein BTM21_10320 [Clostridium chauvoei]MBX7279816.1 regulatory YrvL family protein [Clostridium chauvoei]MBX7282266.1 regulatory YrvL family protein [Clostridium chauvoei]MBX7284706.1 regulatory YrvL family protein [Clostridium chauvoei]